ncbi:Zn-dependent protease with chaperone function [Haloferula luteola]|uniref:Zn-dependent protease with chaperone function n=1 Tax=Haloferula luteola TaxID=595692 RepID=A0A840VC56_9BACT|nr:PLDc N-terminal domain-containing protein [Haloferula luteola]MBB5352248.1 Zn-dependent protease with chaperone function [Haloferula luteola]
MNASSSMEGAPIFLVVILLLVGVVGWGLWLWSLIHCIRNRYLSDQNRLIGIVLIVALSLLGSLVYLFLPRERELQR